MKYTVKNILFVIVGFSTLAIYSQNIAVIDMRAAVLSTQVAQDAFKALEEESEYSSMVEQAQQLQSDRQSLVEKLQKDGETLSPEEVNSLQRDVQEKTTDLEFILGKIQAKQTETVEVVTRQLDPALRKILAELIEAKQIEILLGSENPVLYARESLVITDDVTSMLDVAASTSEGNSDSN